MMEMQIAFCRIVLLQRVSMDPTSDGAFGCFWSMPSRFMPLIILGKGVRR
jgi:hypothetical protein